MGNMRCSYVAAYLEYTKSWSMYRLVIRHKSYQQWLKFSSKRL